MKEDEKIRDKNRRAPQSGGGSREDVPHRTSIKAAREAQHSHRPKTTQPAGEAKKASRPAGERVNRPAGERVNRPAGERATRPAGERVNRPAGERVARPAGERASRPTGERANRPAGERATRPAARPVGQTGEGRPTRQAAEQKNEERKQTRIHPERETKSRSIHQKADSHGKKAEKKSGKKSGKKADEKKGKKKSNLISNIILVVAIIVFCVSAFQLFNIFKGYHEGRSEYDKVRKLAVTTDKKKADKETGDGFQVNFEELLKMNPDTIGWIRFTPEPAQINYPIVQGQDNEKYLKTTFTANENTLGAIFLNVDNLSDYSDKNSIIYGHRMKDGSMFRHLQDYDSKSFWEKNPYFYIYTLDGRKLTYHIYSVGQVEDTSDTYLTSFESEEAYQSFLDMTKEVAMYDTGVEVTTEDKIVTLSTCTSASDEHRFVVRGVLEKEEQVKK